MYLIPKNIKTKREIFKGFGIFECIAVAIVPSYKLKVIFFCVPPLLTFLLLLPLPNGSTALTIFRKFLRFKKNQRCYKVK